MTLPEQQPVLDYASPGMKTPLRLAGQSIIDVIDDGEKVEVIETLAGKGSALAAIIFTTSTVAILGNTLFGRQQGAGLGPTLIYMAFVAIVVTLILAIIHQNWRKTVLCVKETEAQLLFATPFSSRGFAWKTEEVQKYQVRQDLDAITERIVHELHIVFWSRTLIKLFTGQHVRFLTQIANQLEMKTRFEES